RMKMVSQRARVQQQGWLLQAQYLWQPAPARMTHLQLSPPQHMQIGLAVASREFSDAAQGANVMQLGTNHELLQDAGESVYGVIKGHVRFGMLCERNGPNCTRGSDTMHLSVNQSSTQEPKNVSGKSAIRKCPASQPTPARPDSQGFWRHPQHVQGRRQFTGGTAEHVGLLRRTGPGHARRKAGR